MAKKRSSFIQTAYKKRVQKKDAKSRRKAEQRASLPKSRILQVIYRMHPKRVYRYWFSRDGLMMALKLTGAGFATMVILVMGVFAYFRKDLPDPRAVGSRILDQSTQFYDRTGQHLLYEVHGDENRRVVEFDEISEKVIWAAVAVEDKGLLRTPRC